MKINFIKKLLLVAPCIAIAGAAVLVNNTLAADADFGISMSPMNQKIVLTPGETYAGSFRITNPDSHTEDFPYNVVVQPFYVNEDYAPYYNENNGDYNQIVNWITTDITEGVVSPNQTQEIHFTIDVPEDAPAGGQYAAITVASKMSGGSTVQGGLNLKVSQAMAHIVFAEIAGTTVRNGEVVSADVPGFLFSGNISGSSTIKNTGNVHSTASYKLQVFPLFSDEEIFTNEENPDTATILPDRALYNATEWDKTPSVGIFNVVYTAEFEGVTTEVKKMVIVCPIWLLAIIIFAIISIIIYLVAKSKNRKKGN